MLTLLPGALWAALAGVPEVPVPGRSYPRAWASFTNDDLGPNMDENVDDRRTASFNAGYRHERWMILADFAILTDRPRDRRTDEITLSVGRRIVDPGSVSLGAYDEFELLVGVGVRFTDNFQGDEIQNRFHRFIDVEEFDLAYEDGDPELLGWFSGDWRLVRPLGGSPGEGWQIGVATSMRGLITSEGTAKLSPTVHAVLGHPHFDAWFGLRREWRSGSTTTGTKETVFEYEEGTWVSYGLSPWRSILFQGGYNVDTDESYGTIGWVWPAVR